MEAHDAWHLVRRCTVRPNQEICQNVDMIPEDQECENAQDGVNFLASHRHMVLAMQQLFPSHPELFEGFVTFPFEAKDVPEEWRDRFGSGWSPGILSMATVLQNIEDNLGLFPTEGDLGRYIQCGMGATGASSIHGALHFKWAVNDSPYSLGKQQVNISNYMFYKLHGWIDEVWRRYRAATGLPVTDAALDALLVEQCHEMHALADLFDEDDDEEEPLPEESGYFHEVVRPLFESSEHKCNTCHSEISPPAGLSLGGQVSSAEIVAQLVNQPSVYGGQFALVVPGEPELSWLYLKASGLAETAGCVGENCSPRMMPPGAETTGLDGALTEEGLGILYQWILNGALGPLDE